MSAATQLRQGAEAIAAATPDVEMPQHVGHDSLASALVHALADLIVVEKSGTGNYGTYADLADLGRLAKPTLASHGLTYMQNLHGHENGLAVTTILLHESGEREVHGPLPFPHGQNAQATGSYITYMRRYALAAALGLAPGDADDDGAAAQPRQPVQVWNHNMVKARLVELFDGDKEKAAEAYRVGHGGEQEPSAGLADRLHADWVANQPAEPEGGES